MMTPDMLGDVDADAYNAAYDSDLDGRLPGVPGASAYRHIPGGPITDFWWLRFGIVTDLPDPERTTR